MLSKPKDKHRTTMAETDNLPHVGIYVLAYMGKIVYVGKAEESVIARLEQHCRNCNKESLGNWLINLRDDWCNIRLDVLEPPDNGDTHSWLVSAEAALIRKFKPLFNVQLQRG